MGEAAQELAVGRAPVPGDELRAIKRYLATRKDKLPWLFVSEREAPMTRQAVNYLIRSAGKKAKLGRVWPHMLRHSCGYYLANTGVDLRTAQDYLGHRDPKHTVRYTRVAGWRFEGLWRLVTLWTPPYVPVRQRPRILAARSTDTVWRAGAEDGSCAAGGHAHISNSPAMLAGMKRLREA